jgi:uncharacterized protein YdaU (DUF1376 family)
MSTARFPWLKWYPRDFASATRTWPLEARAVYRELLDAQWDIGGSSAGMLPDDEEQLRALVRATPAQWRAAWRFVEAKFPRVEGGRRNARLEQHREAAIREYAGRSKGAAATNRRRWADRSRSAQRSVSDTVSDRSANQSANRSATNERLASSSSTRSEEVRGLRRGSQGRGVDSSASSVPGARNGVGMSVSAPTEPELASSPALRAAREKPDA